MANPERILEELRALPADFSMSRLRVLLEGLGWQLRPGKGSHLICRSPRGRNIPLPVSKNKVKREYLRLLLKEIEQSSSDGKEAGDDD